MGQVPLEICQAGPYPNFVEHLLSDRFIEILSSLRVDNFLEDDLVDDLVEGPPGEDV